MASATINASTKRGRPATGKGQQVVVRLQPGDLELLDLWIAANDAAMSRPEAMRRILRQTIPETDAWMASFDEPSD